MLNDTEQNILRKALLHNKGQMSYYLVLAVLLIILSWGLYLTLQRSGALILAIIISCSIWYYPWRYYQKVKAIESDLAKQEKIDISTIVYGKGISKINKIQPYYYIYTEEEDFEVDKHLYNALKEDDKIRVVYAATSKIILGLKRI